MMNRSPGVNENSTGEIMIRAAGHADLNVLYEVCRNAYSENFSNHWNPGGLEWYLQKVYSLDGIEKELNNPMICYFMAFCDGEPAGFMKLKLDSDLDSNFGAGLEIDKIYFRPQFQGKGIGKQLMQHAIELSNKLNKKIIWLGVIDTNLSAFEFYKKLGFREYDKVRLDLPYFKEELKGMWRMVKQL